jgi:hypothetical protein
MPRISKFRIWIVYMRVPLQRLLQVPVMMLVFDYLVLDPRLEKLRHPP